MTLNDIPGIIFTESQLQDLPLLPPNDDRWTPTTHDIIELEEHLIDYLKSSKHPSAPKIRNKIASYKRQYIGYEKDRKLFIYVNAFPEWLANKDGRWRDEFILVEDGGSNFFQLIYNMETEKIVCFNVNGEA